MSTLGTYTTTDQVRDHGRELARLAKPRGTKPRLSARILRARRAR